MCFFSLQNAFWATLGYSALTVGTVFNVIGMVTVLYVIPFLMYVFKPLLVFFRFFLHPLLRLFNWALGMVSNVLLFPLDPATRANVWKLFPLGVGMLYEIGIFARSIFGDTFVPSCGFSEYMILPWNGTGSFCVRMRRFLHFLFHVIVPKFPLRASHPWVVAHFNAQFAGIVCREDYTPSVHDLPSPSFKSGLNDQNGFEFRNERWIYVNGMCTDKNVFLLNRNHLENVFKRPIFGIHNTSDGFMIDLLECVFGKMGLNLAPAVQKISDQVTAFATMPGVDKVVLVCHSQGTILAAAALQRLVKANYPPRENLAKLHVIAFANCASTMPAPGGSTVESICNINDAVARLGSLAAPELQRLIGMRFAGRLWICNQTGHLLGEHYLGSESANQLQWMIDNPTLGMGASDAAFFLTGLDYPNGFALPGPFDD